MPLTMCASSPQPVLDDRLLLREGLDPVRPLAVHVAARGQPKANKTATPRSPFPVLLSQRDRGPGGNTQDSGGQ